METEKTPNFQGYLEKAGGIMLPDFKQYYKLQSSKQYDTGTETEI